MQISVIIPSYKPQGYLYDCLKSIESQTISNNEFEVIIILNGCNEPYNSRIRSYIDNEMRYMNVRVIQTDIPGVSNARNIGIEAANGDYLTFIDDDDLISTTYLEELLSVSSPTCVGCSNSYAFLNNINERRYNFISEAFEMCKKTSFSTFKYRSFLSPPWCKLIHRDIIGQIRFDTTIKKGEDGLFCFAISPHFCEMKFTSSDSIYFQRMRPGSAMRKKTAFLDELGEFIRQEKAFWGVWKKNLFKYNIAFAMSRFVGVFLNFMIYLKN